MLYTVIGALDGNVADAERESDRLAGIPDVAGEDGENRVEHAFPPSAPARSPSRCRWRTVQRR